MNKKYAAAHSNVVVNPNCQLEQKKKKNMETESQFQNMLELNS